MTLVSHTHKFVFLKTKKTAGSSFEMMLEPYCAPPGHDVVHHTTGHVSEYGIVGVRVSPDRIRELKAEGLMPYTMVRSASGVETRIYWISHMSAARVRRAIGAPAWDNYTRITAVRNPFTRAVSLFYHNMRTANLDPTIDLTDTRAAFREFVLSDDFATDYEITHIGDKAVFHDAFRLEHREEDIARIGRRLGIHLDAADMVHVKRRPKEQPTTSDRELFDPVVIDAVRRKCAWMFDQFDYSPNVDDADL